MTEQPPGGVSPPSEGPQQPPEDPAAAIGALAEPVRRALYEHVAAATEPVGREEAAARVGVPVHTAKFHLDRLARLGLLRTEFRRLTGRTGPGAGRPAKLYRRAPVDVAVSLPPRHYDVAGQVLAAALDRVAATGEPVPDAVATVAAERGRTIVRDAGRAKVGEGARAEDDPGDPAGQLDRAASVLARHGYEPRRTGGEDAAAGLELANCPFDRLAREHTALVCGANVALVRGALAALRCPALVARLQPARDRCCVTIGTRE